jgi:metallo-beta-lactamase family protein
MKVTFWGAAQTVTGSLHEVAWGGRRYLLDCGLYQGRRAEAFERNRNLPFPAKSVEAVVLSHAHIDHSGNLPSLTRQGFEGDIYATAATVDLCQSMLLDSAFLQEKDAEFVNQRAQRRRGLAASERNGTVEPLYTAEDAQRTLDQLLGGVYRHESPLAHDLTFELFDAGHLLGSGFVLLRAGKNGRQTRLLFSADLGRHGMPILRDPEPAPEADYLILESTYGGKLHDRSEAVLDRIAGTVNRTAERGGRIIVPAFAVGRTQQLVMLLHELVRQQRIPDIPVFVDSPLAVNATEAYRRHPECFDAGTRRYLKDGGDPFGFRMLRYVRDVAESKALNGLRGPMVIISASGMAEAGRILHHLRNNIEDARNTVMIAGFQAEHTLGRRLVEGRQEVNIFGEPVRRRAEVVVINELSGHADQGDLLDWVSPIAAGLKGIFLVHGELPRQLALQAALKDRFNVPVHIPRRGDQVQL